MSFVAPSWSGWTIGVALTLYLPLMFDLLWRPGKTNVALKNRPDALLISVVQPTHDKILPIDNLL